MSDLAENEHADRGKGAEENSPVGSYSLCKSTCMSFLALSLSRSYWKGVLSMGSLVSARMESGAPAVSSSEAVCCNMAVLIESGRPGMIFVAIARRSA